MTDNPSGAIHPTRFLLGWLVASLLLTRFLPLPFPLADEVSELLGVVLLVPGAALLLWSQFTLSRAGTSADHDRETTALVTTGPFRLSRNPIYLALLAILTGMGLRYQSLWAILLAVFVAWALRRWTVVPEERYLTERFGADYRRYRESVRRWV